ncbi:hypothetical protein M9H77_31272 [Catharanthus roseus]|uniref:Uncharacterized protein n=1 Tax=Catharanthus roseus TaxID=4058 RepID=A0ACB9ZZK9_CATRO|nr:hypothetical protein M9H77_31272 [Catharanthus roseus]
MCSTCDITGMTHSCSFPASKRWLLPTVVILVVRFQRNLCPGYYFSCFSSPLQAIVSDDHIPPKTIVVVFGKRAELEWFEGQATTCGSTTTDIALAGLREKYLIPDEYVLLRPALDAPSVPTNCDLFRKYHGVRYGKGGWYTCTSKKPLVLSKPLKLKDWKYRFFFLGDPYASLKSSWTTFTALWEIIDRYPSQLRIRERWPQALLQNCCFYGEVFDRSILREDPSLQEDERVEEEEGMSPICGGRQFGSDPDLGHTLSQELVTPRSSNLHVASDTPASWKDTSSNGKFIFPPFKEGPAPQFDDPFFDKYPIPKLETGEEEILFRHDSNLNVNDRSIDPSVYAEMLDHMVLPRDIIFASQISFSELMKYFPTALMQRCQLAELSHDTKERELVVVDEKERYLQKALLEYVSLERLLGLVINREGHLNPYLVRGICERFVQTTHMRTLFYWWVLIVVQKVVQDLISNIQKTAQRY